MAGRWMVVGLVVGCVWAVGCGAPCETGAQCERDCPPGGVAVCAAHGLCACLIGPDLGVAPGEGDDPSGAADLGAPGPGETAPSGCVIAGPGALRINELMLDGEPTEDAEFVELINPGAAPVDLAGVELTSNRGADQVRRVVFTGGCLPSGAALAVYADRSAWVEPVATGPITAELRSFGFANGGDFDFRLVRGDVVIDRVEGPGDAIAAGVSLNRLPDRSGTAFALHVDVDPGGRPSSPGRCPGGGRYEDGCPTAGGDGPAPERDGGVGDAGLDGPTSDMGVDGAADAGSPDAGPVFDCPLPAPGDIRINEVLIDGLVPRTEADEFVELVNRTGTARRLRGLTLAIGGVGGGWDPRVVITDGCLPAWGALVLHPDPQDWLFEPAPEIPPLIADARLALGNESRAPIALFDGQGIELDRFDPGELPIVEGVSLNRSPDLDGEVWRRHDRIAAGDSSPGTCAGGEPFGVGGCPGGVFGSCAAPTADTLVINEILVDGVQENDRDEFVELVNTGLDPLDLAGLALWSSQSDGVLIERLVFEQGCLPPGPIALYGDRADWRGGEGAVVGRIERLALPNSAPVFVELRRGDLVWRAELPAAFTGPGVSAVRAVDGDPTAAFVAHDSVSAVGSSPGLRADEVAPVEVAP